MMTKNTFVHFVEPGLSAIPETGRSRTASVPLIKFSFSQSMIEVDLPEQDVGRRRPRAITWDEADSDNSPTPVPTPLPLAPQPDSITRMRIKSDYADLCEMDNRGRIISDASTSSFPPIDSEVSPCPTSCSLSPPEAFMEDFQHSVRIAPWLKPKAEPKQAPWLKASQPLEEKTLIMTNNTVTWTSKPKVAKRFNGRQKIILSPAFEIAGRKFKIVAEPAKGETFRDSQGMAILRLKSYDISPLQLGVAFSTSNSPMTEVILLDCSTDLSVAPEVPLDCERKNLRQSIDICMKFVILN